MIAARTKRTIILISMLALVLSHLRPAWAVVEWTVKKQTNLEMSPLDIASSPDGLWVYILSAGEVSIYSALDEKVVERIPLDKPFDRISFSSSGNTIIVSSSSAELVKFIQLDMFQKFAFDGLAFKGPENASVTIAVFSDYQ